MICKTKRLTKAQKRVAIAKDVLKHLATTKVTEGFYCTGEITPDCERDDNAQKHLTALKSCRVCALGSMMISHVRLWDKIKIGFFNPYYSLQGNRIDTNGADIRDVLVKYFPIEQLHDIEAAFELEYIRGGTAGAINFGKRYKNPKSRLKAIMLNIVENKGTFIP